MTRSPDRNLDADGEDGLKAAMDAFRADVSTEPPRGLAERVLASVARGDDEAERFHSVAKRYAAAAAVLLAVGVGGSIWVSGGEGGAANSPSGTLSETPSAPSLADLVEGQMKSEQYVALDALTVGGR